MGVSLSGGRIFFVFKLGEGGEEGSKQETRIRLEKAIKMALFLFSSCEICEKYSQNRG